MENLLLKNYLGKELVFTSEGWINATKTIEVFNKKGLENFMRSKRFNEYLEAFCSFYSLPKDEAVKTLRGGNVKENQAGTYLHPKLVVTFARWISPDFAVWCDMVIYGILTGELEVKYKDLQQDFDKLEEKYDKLFEELRLYQRPEENNDTPEL